MTLHFNALAEGQILQRRNPTEIEANFRLSLLSSIGVLRGEREETDAWVSLETFWSVSLFICFLLCVEVLLIVVVVDNLPCSDDVSRLVARCL